LELFVGRIGTDDPSWWLRYYDDELTTYLVDLLSSAGVHAMGRQAYEGMGPYWQASSGPFAMPMNAIPKAAFSNSLGAETTVHRGGVVEAMQVLKAQDGGPILAHGGARFAQTLTRANLIDEYRPNLHPTALGEAVPLFGSAPQPSLRSARTFPRGTTARLP
jgi:dihydrofolate reductase